MCARNRSGLAMRDMESGKNKTMTAGSRAVSKPIVITTSSEICLLFSCGSAVFDRLETDCYKVNKIQYGKRQRMAHERLWDEAERQTTCLMDWEIPVSPGFRTTATLRTIGRSIVSPRKLSYTAFGSRGVPSIDVPTPVLLAREYFQ